MKDRWCANFNLGECGVSAEDGPPSLAKTVSVQAEPERIILTDMNSIINFLEMQGIHENIRSGELPKTVTVLIPRTQESLRCTASNCRSKQRQCSHYK